MKRLHHILFSLSLILVIFSLNNCDINSPVDIELIGISTENLNFGLFENELQFTVTNNDTLSALWDVITTHDWIEVIPFTGTLYPNSTDTITVKINRSDLEIGEYSGDILIAIQGVTEDLHVQANMEITPVPVFLPQQQYLSASDDGGDFSIENYGNYELKWKVFSLEDWLTVEPDSAVTDPDNPDQQIKDYEQKEIEDASTVYFEVNRNNLNPGVHVGIMEVVSNVGTDSIYVTVLQDEDPLLSVSETELHFNAATTSQTITIDNEGGGILEWEADSPDDWVDIDPHRGEISSQALLAKLSKYHIITKTLSTNEIEVEISVDIDELEPGENFSRVNISSNGGDETIELTVNVPEEEAPYLNVEPTELYFGLTESDLSFEITNLGGGTLEWNLSVSGDFAPFVNVDALEGTTDSETDVINVRVDRNIDPDVYEAEILISSNGGDEKIKLSWMVQAEIPTVLTDAPLFTLKEIIEDLSSLIPSEDDKADSIIEKAITNVDKCLEDELWEDEWHLTEKGKKVFDEKKKAVKELEKIIRDNDNANNTLKSKTQEAINKLVAVAQALAQKVISDAEDSGSESEDLEKARKEMVNAGQEFGKGNYNSAIDNFKKAWEHARKSAPKQPELKVKPESLDFGSVENKLSFEISNKGGGTLTWNISVSGDFATYVTIDAAEGTTENENDEVTVAVDRSLDPGLYRAEILVASNGGETSIPVSWKISGTIPPLAASPKLTLEALIDWLVSLLPTGDDKTDKGFEKAVESIKESLANDYWNDEWHLTQKGNKVFDEIKKAVKELDKIAGDTDNILMNSEAQDAMNHLVAVARALAQKVIDEAEDAGGKESEIDKAQKEMENAQKELDNDHFEQAVDRYKKAWENALKAIPDPPILKVSPSELNFGTSENELEIEIKNDGDGILSWNLAVAGSLASHLQIDAAEGTTTTEKDIVKVTLNRSQETGVYSAAIIITSNGGEEEINVGWIVHGTIPTVTTSPNLFLQNVVDALTSLIPSGDDKTDEGIGKAAESIKNALDTEYWIDDWHLADDGKKVFDESKKAVKELEKIFDEPVEDQLKNKALAAIYRIVAAAKALAEKIIDEAKEADGDSEELDKAQAEMNKAESELGKGEFDKAIDKFKKAWERGIKAMPDPPKLKVSPTELDFGTDKTELSFKISNDGEETLIWSLSVSGDHASHIVTDVTEGTTTTEEDVVTVKVDRGLDPGTYSGKISVASNGGAKDVTVRWEIEGTVQLQPVLKVTPTELDFGTDDTELKFEISNDGDGTLNWSLSVSGSYASHIITDVTEGTTTTEDDIVIVKVNRELDEGTYSGTISVASNGGEIDIPVRWKIEGTVVPQNPVNSTLENIVDGLKGLIPSGNEKADEGIAKAIDSINKALDADLWLDEWHLKENGKKVFDEMKKGVKELVKVIDDYSDDELQSKLQDVVNKLVEIAGKLAETAIEDAKAAGGDADELNKALEDLESGQKEADEGNFEKAIDNYKKAWEHAVNA